MKTLRLFVLIVIPVLLTVAAVGVKMVSALPEFPQANAWYQAFPSVVWCDDPESTTMLTVHIEGRTDVARAWIVDDVTETVSEENFELFDDGTHGDQVAGDSVFTLGGVSLPCESERIMEFGWKHWLGFLRVELTNGQMQENNYGFMVGIVDPAYKGVFEVQDLAPGLTATAYSFFIEDGAHEVIDDYPISSVVCGVSNFEAYKKLYSVFPDVFDFAALMPGLPIYRPGNLAENVPYNVLVSNEVEHIGIDIFDNSAKFGSAGRLKSVVYQSFSTIAIFDHEIAHTWGAAIGQDLGLISPRYNYDVNQGHWNENADMEGQLGSYLFTDNGRVGHLSDNGDGTWRLIANHVTEPYSPLELYVMGLIPPEEVPPVHVLSGQQSANPQAITAGSFKTVTIEDIIAAEGGERVPSYLDSQKDFTLAFIVTQDQPYNEAAYAFFSLISYQLATRQGVSEANRSYGPFYWATGGRATIETLLPLDLAVTKLPDRPYGLMEETEEEEPATAEEEPVPVEDQPAPTDPPEPTVEEREDRGGEEIEVVEPDRQPICGLIPAGIVFLPLLFTMRNRKKDD